MCVLMWYIMPVFLLDSELHISFFLGLYVDRILRVGLGKPVISLKLRLDSKIIILTSMGLAFILGAIAWLFSIDQTVHGRLYDYGLQFSNEWAFSYWTFLGLALLMLGCAIYVNALSLVYLIRARRASPRANTT